MGHHFSSRLTATLNLCLIYFKIPWALAILLEHMHKKFEINRTKIEQKVFQGRVAVYFMFYNIYSKYNKHINTRILKAFSATSIGSVWRSYMGCRHDQHSSGTHWFFRVLQRSTANPGRPIFSLLFTFSVQKTHTKKIKHITRVGFPQFGKFTTLISYFSYSEIRYNRHLISHSCHSWV